MITSMKEEINSNTIIVGGLNTTLTPMDRSTKQKFSKEIQTLNDTMDQLDPTDVYRTFHPKTINFTFFSSSCGTFFRIDHIQGHKSSLQFSSVQFSRSIVSDALKPHELQHAIVTYYLGFSRIWKERKTKKKKSVP